MMETTRKLDRIAACFKVAFSSYCIVLPSALTWSSWPPPDLGLGAMMAVLWFVAACALVAMWIEL